MDVVAAEGGGRRRRRGTSRRRARATAEQEGGGDDGLAVSVEKALDTPVAAVAPAPALAPVAPTVLKVGGGPVVHRKPAAPTAAAVPKVVIAPPKKKPAKLLLVPKARVRTHAPKTFKARRVSVVIDNTARTVKRRRQTLQRVEGMSEEQLREAAVAARLSRAETVAKVPADLLRQMLKDYYTMRGKLL